MKPWKEDEHPRDADGKFTKTSTITAHKQLEAYGVNADALPDEWKPLLSKDIGADTQKKYRELGSGIETNRYFDNAEQWQWENGLTEQQKEAIREYTNNEYSTINKYLRWGDDITEKIRSGHLPAIEAALSSYVLREPIKVYRSIDSTVFVWNKDVSELKGKIFHDDAFVSATPTLDSEALTQDTVLIINIPSGKGRGAYINNLSVYKNQEYEFLIQRGCNFRITKAYKKENYIIEMEMITLDG